jgi:hypothetical protein
MRARKNSEPFLEGHPVCLARIGAPRRPIIQFPACFAWFAAMNPWGWVVLCDPLAGQDSPPWV